MEPTETQPQAEPSVEGDTIDMARLQALQNRLEAEQSLAGGVCAGLGATLAQPKLAWELLRLAFQPLDLLFYGIALYEGYKFSFRRITRQELADALTTA